jgi:hypothetical protein
LRLDFTNLVFKGRLGYGSGSQDFSSWSYSQKAALGDIQFAYGFDLGPTRLSTGISVMAAKIWQEFNNNDKQDSWLLRTSGDFSLLYPRRSPIAGELTFSAGILRSQGAGMGADYLWRGYLGGSLSVLVRFR